MISADMTRESRTAISASPEVQNPAELCTCAGCGECGLVYIHSLKQVITWFSNREFEPCQCALCQCDEVIDGEDLLCTPCRDGNGVSRHYKEEIERRLEKATEHLLPAIVYIRKETMHCGSA